MGQLDQFAKDTFADETSKVTRGGAEWQLPPELGMSEVRLDGLLRVRDPAPLRTLAAPWCLTGTADELVLEVKMAGEHLDVPSFDRACLRRLARQVYRWEDADDPFDGEVPLWYLASHVSAIIRERRPVTEVAEGCYRIGPEWAATLWIAANELPLADELVPFLIARSGRALDDFVRWVMPRRPFSWLAGVLRYLPMSTAAYDDLRALWLQPADDPTIAARDESLFQWLLDQKPERREQLVEKGRLEGERRSLRHVLARRQIALAPEDQARIDACTDLDTLLRWLDQAVAASTAAEALR